MTLNDFILSGKASHRIARHLAFWGAYCLFFFYSGFDPEETKDLFTFKKYGISITRVLCFLPVSLLSVYTFVYILVPYFILKKRYAGFVLMAILTIAVVFGLDFYFGKIFLQLVNHNQSPVGLIHDAWLYAMYGGIDNTIPVSFCAMAIKLSKSIYAKQKENTKLAAQKRIYNTQLIRNNIQPVFFFRSLNSLHTKIDAGSPDASTMIVELSDLFSYILYERNNEQILLEQEITAVRNFISIQGLNHPNGAKINLRLSGDCSHKYILSSTLFRIFQDVLSINDNMSQEPAIVDAVINIAETSLSLSLVFKTIPGFDLQAFIASSGHENIHFQAAMNTLEKSHSLSLQTSLYASEEVTTQYNNQPNILMRRHDN